MISILESIPGPLFLDYFFLFSLFLIMLAWFLTRFDQTWSQILPSPNRFDADALAYLEGREMGVIRTSTFRLWQQGLLRMGGSTKKQPDHPLSAMDQETLTALQGALPIRSSDLIPVKTRLKPHLTLLASRLENAGLVYRPHKPDRKLKIQFLTSVPLWGIGGTKLMLGLFNGRPFLFLLLILIIAQIVIILIIRHTPHRTTLGRRFLNKTRKHFFWLQTWKKNPNLDQEIDPALGVALFGGAFLLGFPGTEGIFGIFQTRNNPMSGDGGGSSGGGGCGGDSSGGGGCGGCGGGGD